MRLEMLVGMLDEILDGQSSFLFSNEPNEKRPVMTIQDFAGSHFRYWVGDNQMIEMVYIDELVLLWDDDMVL